MSDIDVYADIPEREPVPERRSGVVLKRDYVTGPAVLEILDLPSNGRVINVSLSASTGEVAYVDVRLMVSKQQLYDLVAVMTEVPEGGS